MHNLLQLLRYKNLILIALIQLLMHENILVPILQKYGFTQSLSGHYLWLLILSTVFIAAGGYVLNDYFDLKIDRINHPDKQIIGKVITKKSSMILYQALTFCGVVTGIILSWFSKSLTLAFIFIIVPGLLWFYSASYKRQFLTGNLIVALISGLSVLIVSIFGLAFIKKEFGDLIFETPIPAEIQSWIGGFALFAFLTTWIREIIKDMEDEFGDRELECRTMPIVWGIKKTKIFIYALILTEISLLLYLNFKVLDGNSLSTKYIIFGLILPFIFLTYLVFKSKTPKNFEQATNFIKFIMMIGVMYSFIFYFTTAKTFHLSLFNIFVIK